MIRGESKIETVTDWRREEGYYLHSKSKESEARAEKGGR
jgi:hypothetical protein